MSIKPGVLFIGHLTEYNIYRTKKERKNYGYQ